MVRLAPWFAAFALGLAALAPGAHAASPLAGQWHFDEVLPVNPSDGESPGFTPDSSGNGLDLVGPQGAIQLLPDGKFASHLSDSNSGHSETASSALLAPPRVTMLGWFRRSDTGGFSYIAGRGWNATCDPSSYALVIPPPANDGDGVIFQVRGTLGQVIASPKAPSSTWDIQWHMIAGVYDGSRVRLYVDGNQVGSGTPAPGLNINYAMSNNSVYADGYPAGGACEGGNFGGGIDELRVYDRALSGTEIGRLASATGPNPPALVPDPSPPLPRPKPAVVRPSASFVPLRLGSIKKLILNAGKTTGAKTLRWDLNGDKRTDLECPGSQPALGLSLSTSKTLNVRLTAVGANGSTSTTTKRVITIRSIGKSIAKTTPESATCAPSVAAIASPPKACANQSVIFALTEARGCFSRTKDPNDVPSAERAVARRHYESLQYSSFTMLICGKAATKPVFQKQCDVLKKADKESLEFYVAQGPVNLNGVVIRPTAGRNVVVVPSLKRVFSSRATMAWGSIAVPAFGGSAVDVDLTSIKKVLSLRGSKIPVDGVSAPLFSFDGKKDLPAIDGFRLDGRIDLALRVRNGKRYSQGTVRLTLPPVFSLFGGKPPSGLVNLLATSDGGPVLDQLEISVPQANFGGVLITDLSFKYSLFGGIDGDHSPGTSCARKEWKGRGNVYLLGKAGGNAGFKLTPPPPQNGIGFCAGGFKHFGAALTFGGPIPKPQLFPGIFLDELNFGIQLNPLLVRGGGQISALELARVRGALLMAFATPNQPYLLSARDGPELAPLGNHLLKSTSFALGGNLAIKVPALGEIPLASGALLYSYPDYIAFNGNASVDAGIFKVFGVVGGEASFSRKLFSTFGSVNACVAGIKKGLCFGADGWVTSRGAVVCANVNLLVADLHPGAGYYWGGGLTIWFPDGCKPSRYWVKFASASASQAKATTFTLARGEAGKGVAVKGKGGAPALRVTSPTGEVLNIEQDGFIGSPKKDMVGIRTAAGTTFIGVSRKGPPGTYRVETLPGSPPIASVAASRPGYDTNFKARVTGKGSKRTLVYDARKRGGQKVSFFEKGRDVYHLLGTRTGGKGKIRFTPAPGSGGVRRIVTLATLDKTPIPDQTLAKFKVAGTPKTGKPGRVKVKRRGRTLSISWTKARGARRYGVVVEYGNGKERTFSLGAKRRKLRVRKVPLTERGTVRVSAQGIMRDWAKPRIKRFKRLKRPATLLQTNSFNERKTARRKQQALKRKQAKRRKSHRR